MLGNNTNQIEGNHPGVEGLSPLSPPCETLILIKAVHSINRALKLAGMIHSQHLV